MDALTFVSTMVSALAWPSVAIVVIMILRKPMAELLPLLRRLKYKDLEFKFGERIAEVQADVATLVNHQEIAQDAQRGRLRVDPYSIRLRHTSERIDERYFRVRVWLDAPDDFISTVEKVIYERHSTFQQRLKEVTLPPFEDRFKCWGEFTIRAKIHLKNGEVLRRQRFLALVDSPPEVMEES
jgi:hypothetical protein